MSLMRRLWIRYCQTPGARLAALALGTRVRGDSPAMTKPPAALRTAAARSWRAELCASLDACFSELPMRQPM